MRKRKDKKPIFKKWWFWLIIIILVSALFGSTGSNSEDTQDSVDSVAEVGSPAAENPDPIFTMYSTDAIGATNHTVVGGKYEPTGTYKVVCTSGHGCLNINDKELLVLAVDEYVGKEYSGMIYEESLDVKLDANDKLMARAYNSSNFKLEFYLSK